MPLNINKRLFLLLLCIFIDFVLTSEYPAENICNKEGHCYPKVFIATNYFQEVLEGQEIPAGLHVKIDFETGKKYAKLLDHDNNEPTDIIIVDKDGLIHSDPVQIESSEVDTSQDAKVNIHHEDSLKTFPVIPPGQKENLRISHSDNLLFEECVSKLTTTPQSLHGIISTLDSLEDLVHELDFGIKLAKSNGLISIVKLLDNDSNKVREKAALVIGTTVQNNPIAQDEALKLDLIPYLLDLLSSETDIKVSSRLLYALSSVVRGNKESIQSINDNQGLSRLATVYQKLDNNDFRAKCAVFVADFIDPNMFNIVHKKFNLFDQNHHNIVSPFENVIEIWCNLLQDTLFDDMGNDKEIDFDTREKILSGISMIKSQYSRQCPIHIGFKNWLLKQTNSDSDEYFLSLVNQVKIQYGLT